MPFTTIQPSFAGGELAPALWARVDLAKYAVGARTLRNMIVHPHGGVSNRPGTEFIARVKSAKRKVRLIPFQFSTAQAYVLEFGDRYIRFYTNDGQIIDPTGIAPAWSSTASYYLEGSIVSYNGQNWIAIQDILTEVNLWPPGTYKTSPWATYTDPVPIEIASPWTLEELDSIKYTQSADILYICHPNHCPYTLSRITHTIWLLNEFLYINGPVLPENLNPEITVKVTGYCQLLRPDADIEVGTWAYTPLFSRINEVIPDDGTQVNCTGTSTMKVRLSSARVPYNKNKKGHILRIRLAATTESDGTLVLYSAGNSKTVASWNIRVTTKLTTRAFYITPEQVSLIHTYNSGGIDYYGELQVWVTLTDGNVSWIEMQVPYAVGATNTAVTDYPLFEGDSVVLEAYGTSTLFESGHKGAIWGIRHVGLSSSHYILTPERGVWQSSAIPVIGEWQVILESTNRDQSALYMEKSVDDGRTWYKVRTWPATTSTATIVVTGIEDSFCYIRFVREEDPTAGDIAAFTVTINGTLRWAFAKINVPNGNTAEATLLTDFDRPGIKFITWAEGAWSDKQGWPSCVEFFEDRLCFANTKSQPQTIWMSKTSDYNNFGVSIPLQDDDAVTSTISSRTINAIQSLVNLNELLAFTSNCEWAISSGGNGPVTPTNIQPRAQSYAGSSLVDPVMAGQALLYVQRQGATVREFLYNYDTAGFLGNDVSVLSKHLLLRHTIIDMAYQQEPYSIVWMVRDDGIVLGFTYMREHEVFAWHWHDTQGKFESICVIPGLQQDEVWVEVYRIINGVDQRFIERFKRREDANIYDAFYVDCGLSYSGPQVDTLAGLQHLEGMTVSVVADGKAFTNLVVQKGQVILPNQQSTSRAHAGLPFVSELETLNIEYTLNEGTSQGKLKRISRVTLRLQESQGGKCGPDELHLKPLRYSSTNAFSGDITIDLTSGYDTGGRFIVRQEEPLPITILGVIPEISHGG